MSDIAKNLTHVQAHNLVAAFILSLKKIQNRTFPEILCPVICNFDWRPEKRGPCAWFSPDRKNGHFMYFFLVSYDGKRCCITVLKKSLIIIRSLLWRQCAVGFGFPIWFVWIPVLRLQYLILNFLCFGSNATDETFLGM